MQQGKSQNAALGQHYYKILARPCTKIQGILEKCLPANRNKTGYTNYGLIFVPINFVSYHYFILSIQFFKFLNLADGGVEVEVAKWLGVQRLAPSSRWQKVKSLTESQSPYTALNTFSVTQ